MKTLYIIKSLLSSDKRYMIIVSVCFVITSFLFNLSVAVTEDYVRQKLYVARNRYDESFTTIQVGSVYPLSDEFLSELLESVGIKAELNNAFVGHILMNENSAVSENEIYNMPPQSMGNYMKAELLCPYTTEYSKLFETKLSGEVPDINKDYNGKIPVIASFSSGLSIGDELKAKIGGKLTYFVVTAKYTDDNLEVFFSAGKKIYTDKEILYKSGVLKRPEDQPVYSAESEERYNGSFLLRIPDDMTNLEVDARLSYLNENMPVVDTYISEDHVIKTDIMVDGDKKYVILFIPMILLIFAIGIFGTVSNHIINYDKKKKMLKVFAICGANKRKRLLCNVLCEVIIVFSSLICAIGLSVIFDMLFGDKLTSITETTISPLSVSLTCGVIIGVTVIMVTIWIASDKLRKEKLL